jgi:MarR family transcriptional regulator, 2-MHQ and catechol-resistance regulon repressor
MAKTATSRGSKGTEAVFHSFLRADGLLRQIMEPYFARFGVSGPQWGVLRVLQRAELNGEQGLRLKDVGARLFIQPPSVTAVVDRLERLGYVKRSGSKEDLRVRCVRLTSQGRRLLAEVLEHHLKKVESLFRGLSMSERATLGKLLAKFEEHLRTLAPRRRDNHGENYA